MPQETTAVPLPTLAEVVALMREHGLTRIEFHDNGCPKIVEREPDVVIPPPPVREPSETDAPEKLGINTVAGAQALLMANRTLRGRAHGNQ
jgi:hypothetical protein